ncbi:MAG: glycosyltransferase family 2 protein, partial [Gemmatimonadaceae bacterium]
MLYLCIPSHNEAPTIGVLLWRIRKVFQEYTREYEILVYDDASTDATREVLAPYAKALTVLGARERVGYARAVRALLGEASARTSYPRRDAVVLLQADFTDQPEGIPDLVKRFEGGADIVVAEREWPAGTPERVRTLQRLAAWLPRLWPIRDAVSVPGVKDPWGTFRLMRIAVVRDLLRAAERSPAEPSDAPWQANLELLRAAAPHARRIETVTLSPRFDVRDRGTRRDPWPDAWGLLRAGGGG